MLVSNNVFKNRYVWDGSQTNFPISFPFLDNNHIQVWYAEPGKLDTDAVILGKENYTITGAGNPAGGVLTRTTAWAVGATIAIVRNVPITQLHQYTQYDNFPAKSHEDALAKLTMIDQQQQEILNRSVKLPVTDPRSPEEYAQDLLGARDEAKYWAEYAEKQADHTVQVPSETMVLASNSVTPRTLADRFADVVNVKDFGAKGDGVTDDTEAIQAALDACPVGGVVLIPFGQYVITDTLSVSKAISIRGEAFGGAHSCIRCKNITDKVFHITTANTYFDNFELTGTGSQKPKYGFYFDPLANPQENVDVDCWFHGVFTCYMQTGIYCRGRGLNMFDCEFAGLNYCIELDWPDEADFRDGNYGFETWEQGFRGFILSNLRFHSCVYGVKNAGINADKIKGLFLSNIYADTGCEIFVGKLIRSSISNIQVINAFQGSKIISLSSGSKDYTINGVYGIAPDAGVVNSSGEGIEYRLNAFIYGEGTQTRGIISNCFFGRSTLHGISFMNTSICEDIVIDNIHMQDVGWSLTDKSTCYPVLFNGSATRCKVNNINYVDTSDYGNTLKYIVYASSSATDVEVGKVIKNVDVAITNSASTGLVRSNVCHPLGKSGFTSFLDVVNSSGDVVHSLQSYADGTNIKINVPNGNIFVNMGTAEGSGLKPYTDNVWRLGSVENRWTQVYATTATINTSDEREKKNIEAISDAVFRAWGRVQFRQFLFRDAVEKKGESARLHAGIIAQQVKDAFEIEGLDATRYGLLCYDKWEDKYEDVEVEDEPPVLDADGNEVTPAKTHTEKRLVTAAGDRYGIRYSEALCIEAAYQRRCAYRLEARMEILEKRVKELQALITGLSTTGYTVS